MPSLYRIFYHGIVSIVYSIIVNFVQVLNVILWRKYIQLNMTCSSAIYRITLCVRVVALLLITCITFVPTIVVTVAHYFANVPCYCTSAVNVLLHGCESSTDAHDIAISELEYLLLAPCKQDNYWNSSRYPIANIIKLINYSKGVSESHGASISVIVNGFKKLHPVLTFDLSHTSLN